MCLIKTCSLNLYITNVYVVRYYNAKFLGMFSVLRSAIFD